MILLSSILVNYKEKIQSRFDRGTYIKKYIDEKLKPFTKVPEMDIDLIVKGGHKVNDKAYDLLLELANGGK